MISDIEYVRQLDSEIAEDYQRAIEFISVSPDYACLCLRKAGEALCQKMAEKSSLTIDNLNLDKRINKLYEHSIINYHTKESFHEMRKICNTWVHKNKRSQTQSKHDLEIDGKRRHIEEAQNARKFFLDVTDGVFGIFINGKIAPKYTVSELETQKNKDIIYSACMSISSQAKMKAGLVFEAIGDEQGNFDFNEDSPNSYTKKGLVCPKHEYRHFTYLYELAAESYDSACYISARERESNSQRENSAYEKRAEAWIASNCDLESLFRFGALTCEGRLGDDKKALAGVSKVSGQKSRLLKTIQHISSWIFVRPHASLRSRMRP